MKCGLEYAEQGLPGTLKSVGTVTRGGGPARWCRFSPVDLPEDQTN